MSLFSFFRRDKTAQDNNRAAGRNAPPANEKQGRRGRGTLEEDPQLPEKQRARRRLIGSIVLVAAALIVLPLVFESKPQKPNLNVALQVDSKVSSPGVQPEPQTAPADQNAQPPADQSTPPPSDQQAPPQNAGVAAPEPASNTAPAPVSEPVKEAEPDRSAEKAKADRAEREKASREQAEKERKAKTEREKADREREAKVKADREKSDKERAEKERKARIEREKAAKKKTASGDPIGQMIVNKTKRR